MNSEDNPVMVSPTETRSPVAIILDADEKREVIFEGEAVLLIEQYVKSITPFLISPSTGLPERLSVSQSKSSRYGMPTRIIVRAAREGHRAIDYEWK